MMARLASRRWPALWRTLASAAAAAALLLAGGCSTLQGLGLAPADKAQAEADRAPVTPAIELTVEAPTALKQLLARHLDIAGLQQVDIALAPNSSEWTRLIRSVPVQARQLLQTEGYFEAEVSVSSDAGAAAAADVARRVTVSVAPGPQVQVASFEVLIEGVLAGVVAAGASPALALQAALADAGPLKPGTGFRDEDWGKTKQKVLTLLRDAGYLAASLVRSQAEIDTDTRSAELRVVVDSGPLFLAGAETVTGLHLQDPQNALNLAGLAPGTPLTEQVLLDYQERLQRVRLYQSVHVSANPDPAQAAAATVRVRLAELPLQQLTLGIGYSDSTGARATLEHTHRRPLDWPVTVYNKLEIGTTAQTWTADVQTHPGPNFYRNVMGIVVDSVQGDTDIVQSQSVRLGRARYTKPIEQLYYVELLRSHQTSELSPPSTAESLSVDYSVLLRRLDSVLLPTRGYALSMQFGLGYATSEQAENGPFTRLYARLTGYFPLGGEWYGQARLELGQVVKNTAVDVPDKLGFRAGGDDSVRGYGYRTLSPRDANGVQYSGMSLATTSVELARPILADLPTVWGAVFVDAGNAAVDFNQIKPVLGYGVGVRWRSPVGPVRADLAWAQELKAVRFILSLGIQL